MKITVITVCYNSSATIAEALASVAAQRHPRVEHIVVDGGSRDGTQQIVRASGQRVAHLISEPDRGIYDAMNKGLSLATGDYVGFLNADDALADPSVLARIADAARDQPDAVYGDLVYVRERRPDRVVRVWHSGSFHHDKLRRGWMPPHPTFYVRRELLGSLGLFDTGMRIAADYDFMMRCLSRPGTRAVYVPHVLVRMRMGGASNSSLRALRRKSAEDLVAIRRYGLGGWGTLLRKNLRKLPQFLARAV
jgi:glycosyltransferase